MFNIKIIRPRIAVVKKFLFYLADLTIEKGGFHGVSMFSRDILLKGLIDPEYESELKSEQVEINENILSKIEDDADVEDSKKLINEVNQENLDFEAVEDSKINQINEKFISVVKSLTPVSQLLLDRIYKNL